MPHSQKPGTGKKLSRTELIQYRELAKRMAEQMCRRYDHLGGYADDMASKAFEAYVRKIEREEVFNPEAFMRWKLNRLRQDRFRKKKTEEHRLTIWHEEMTMRRGQAQFDTADTPQFWLNKRGLSANVISKEEQKMVTLQALAMSQIMPDPLDRSILFDRFYDQRLSISDLARKHGGRSPASMANYLKKLLGTVDEPGQLTSVKEVVGSLSLATADAFCREIETLDDKELVSDPIGAAIGHLEMAGTRSRQHAERATVGISHLRWIRQNLPDNRGMTNKVLNRLVRAGCFYVLETNDARHDEFDDFGLHDDVNVLNAIHSAIRHHRNR